MTDTITKKQFAAQRKAVRWIEDNHPSKKVRNHARILWLAMGEVDDPNDVPAHTKRAIEGCRKRLATAIAEYRATR